MLLDLIAGARPNFVKLAPVIRAVEEASAAGHNISFRFIHTGQHSSPEMSAAMMRDLEMPAPHIDLCCTGKTRGAMLASVIKEYDRVLQDKKPDWTVVVGDVTSTLGAALAAKAADLRVAHIEAGLRSGDRTMPEELNRIATDSIADLHFTTSRSAGENLIREGVDLTRIHFVGNVMADSLLQTMPLLRRPQLFDELGLVPGGYVLLTLHRPANVDEPSALQNWIAAVVEACPEMPIVFPVHPRTRQALVGNGNLSPTIQIMSPMPYATFLYFQQQAAIIITDSGGVSEEATILRRPCVTVRTTTERPETVKDGTNVLAGSFSDIARSVEKARLKAQFHSFQPESWDGKSSQQIVNTLLAV